MMGAMGGRRAIIVATAAGVVAAAASIALRPRLDAVRTSFRRSSSPGARTYDIVVGILLGGYYADVASDCAAALAGVDAPCVLEVGPGPGHVAELLLERAPAARWTGLDIDPAMLAVSRRRLERAGVAQRATLVEGDVATLPFGDASFDLVVSSFSAHHWPDPAKGFREVRRVLRPGGRVLVYDVPAAWGRMETGSAGASALAAVFDHPTVSRVRGLGPVTIVARTEARTT